MIKEHLEHYYLEQDCNCAEALLLAANDAWGLGLGPREYKAVSGFGGGLGCGALCGAVAGGVAALGHLCLEGDATGHQNPRLREKCARLAGLVQAELGGLDCSYLKERHFTPGQRCLATVRLVADLADRVRAEE